MLRQLDVTQEVASLKSSLDTRRAFLSKLIILKIECVLVYESFTGFNLAAFSADSTAGDTRSKGFSVFNLVCIKCLTFFSLGGGSDS